MTRWVEILTATVPIHPAASLAVGTHEATQGEVYVMIERVVSRADGSPMAYAKVAVPEYASGFGYILVTPDNYGPNNSKAVRLRSDYVAPPPASEVKGEDAAAAAAARAAQQAADARAQQMYIPPDRQGDGGGALPPATNKGNSIQSLWANKKALIIAGVIVAGIALYWANEVRKQKKLLNK